MNRPDIEGTVRSPDAAEAPRPNGRDVPINIIFETKVIRGLLAYITDLEQRLAQAETNWLLTFDAVLRSVGGRLVIPREHLIAADRRDVISSWEDMDCAVYILSEWEGR